MTSTCPSHPAPEPMPMVGMEMARGNFLRHFLTHKLQHDGKRARAFHRERIGEQRIRLGFRDAFRFVTAFDPHALWQHPKMRHERNSGGNNAPRSAR